MTRANQEFLFQMSNRPRSVVSRVERISPPERPSFSLAASSGGNLGYSQWVQGSTFHLSGSSTSKGNSSQKSSHKSSKKSQKHSRNSSRDRRRRSRSKDRRRSRSRDRRHRSHSRGRIRSRSKEHRRRSSHTKPREEKSRGRSGSRHNTRHRSPFRDLSDNYNRHRRQSSKGASSRHSSSSRHRSPFRDISDNYNRLSNGSAEESGLEEEQEDQKTISNYARRLANLDGVLDLNLRPCSPKPRTAFGSYEQTPKLNLPAAEGFSEIMQDFMKEVKAEEGSKRAGSNLHLPLDLARVPARHKPNMTAYRLAGNEWRTSACNYNSSLTSSAAFKVPTVPKVTVEQERVRQWESSAREELTIASYSTWFLKGAREGLRILQQKYLDMSHQEGNGFEEEQWRVLWKATENIAEFVDSAGKGVKSIAENSISDIGSMLLTRRDAWLGKLTDNKAISKQEMWDLRTADLNGPALFDQEKLEEIHASASKRENENLQKNLWTGMLNKKASQQKQSFQSRPPGRGNSSNASSTQGRGQAPVFGRGGRGGRGGQNFRGKGRGGKPAETVSSNAKSN